MIQIRKNIFETNSSSTHSLTMCTEADWLSWKKGSLVLLKWDERLVSKKELDESNENTNYGLEYFNTPDEFFEWAEEEGYETFKTSLKGVIAFGYYGYN